MREIIVTSLEEGQRLDRVLQKYLSRSSAGFLYKMLRKKNITLNGKKADGKEKLCRGDAIRIYFSEETFAKFIAPKKEEDWPRTKLDIVYEDEQILLINKPAGMLTQKAAPSDISLNEYATGYLLESGAVSRQSLHTFRPSVCNRLDRNTSGIVTVGKTTAALQVLSEMFRDRTIHKYYQALVTGRVDQGRTIDGYLIKDEKENRVRILAKPGKGTEAYRNSSKCRNAGRIAPEGDAMKAQGIAQRIQTKYEPILFCEDGMEEHSMTLLEIELITGRSHQIRAHLASEGHPVVGDPKYGDRTRNAYFARRYGLHSQLLHAGRIVFPEQDSVLGYLGGKEFTAGRPELFDRILMEAQT